MSRFPLLVASVLMLNACGKEESKSEAPAVTATAAAPEEKSAPKPIPLDELSKLVETEEDFEVAAQEEITADQLEAEISKLEKELEAEPE